MALLASASSAQAQRLLTLAPSVEEAASAGAPGPSIGPAPTSVQVDLELLRGAPARLEVPTPEGSVLSAERSMFEDRGGGDLMWSGGEPGAGYDTVVLTVEGGRLVGRFGAPGGGVYQVHAERDGRGGMAPVVGPVLDGSEPWCAVEAGAEGARDAHAVVGAGAADLPERVSDPQSHDRLDILVAYTATAAENWAGRGGARAAIRHAGDYLKMVFRNNQLPVEPRIVHVAQASTALDRAARDLGWNERQRGDHPLWVGIDRDGDMLRLRHEHRADLVHLFTGENPILLRNACGSARLLQNGGTAQSFSDRAYGWTTNHSFCGDYAVTFAHEVGHGLGANHEPDNAGPTSRRFRPYALGHVNFDVMPSVGTAMSYQGQIEPFFSTPRIRPYGAVVGVAGEQDQERLLQETVHIGARYGDYLMSLEGLPAAPSGMRAWFDGASVRLAWRDNAPDADGYELVYRLLRNDQSSVESLLALEGRSEAILPANMIEPGRLYEFWVRAVKGERRSLRSGIVVLAVPAEPIEAPSGVVVRVAPPELGWIEVGWTDNSDNESGFDVQLLKGGEVIARNQEAADSGSSEFYSYDGALQGGAEYQVRVFAYNSSGYSESSETVTFRWTLPRAPQPVTGLDASAIGPTTVRLSWVDNPESDFYWVTAALPGWKHGGFHVEDGVGWADLEGLARGGRYTFEVHPSGFSSHGALVSRTDLTLGGRGRGPRAPTNLSWAMTDDGQVRVSWKDISSDELGFELQSAVSGSDSWKRLAAVPPDTESVVVSSNFLLRRNFRVFAYNERGFSASSRWAHGVPYVEWMTATSGAGEVCPADMTESGRAEKIGLCLHNRRFGVEVGDFFGGEWHGRVVPAGTDGVAIFYFSDPDSWDLLVKVVDGCAINGHYWVLAAAASDLEFDLTVYYRAPGAFWGGHVYAGRRGGRSVVHREAFPGACATPLSPTVEKQSPTVENLTATAGDAEVGLTWNVKLGEAVTGMQVRWKASADLPFDDAADAWTDLRAGARDFKVAGLTNEMEYAFAVRAVQTSGAGPATVARATPRGPPGTSIRLDISCDEDLCRTLTGTRVSFFHAGADNVMEWDWDFGDGATSSLMSPTHTCSTPGFFTVTLTVSDGTSSDSATRTVLVESAVPDGSCLFDQETACLQDSRFEVKANWWTGGSRSGSGRVVYAGTNDSGLFRFFDPLNWEILIKVLDGCGINGRVWVLGASTTDLGYRIQVTDTVTGESRSYVNEPGQAAPAVLDTEAFARPCVGGAGP